MAASSVPDIVVGRLPLYLRALTQMAASGKEITSSQELGERLGISSAQIRKDLSQFGAFGKIGTQIAPLPIEDSSRIVEVVRARGITVAMLAVPRDAAQEVTDRLVEAGGPAHPCYAPPPA